ncbi:MAG: response regulator [Anaerolineales bacterium]
MDSKLAQKILIVDDDLDTLKLVGTTLEKQGYQIIAAKDGIEALERVSQHAPDLILLDIMMPKMDGYEVTRRLRENPATSHIPIIMFTAKGQVDDKVAGLEAGADEYLTKPTHPAELVARVRALLKRPTSMLPPLPGAPRSGHSLVVGVIAAKGGQGVSTLCVNLGAALRERFPKGEVILAELRPGRGDISAIFGFSNSQGLNDLLKADPTRIGRQTVEKALVTHQSGIRLLLASNKPSDGTLINASQQMGAAMRELARIANYIVLDLGVALPLSLQGVLKQCEKVILVVEPDLHTMVHTKGMLQDLDILGVGKNKLICTMVNRVRTELAMSAADVQKSLGVPLDVVFTPAPELAHQAARVKQAMVATEPQSFTAQQVMKLVSLLTESVPAKA